MSDRVTMADVAREVAVSLMTVSRVANNKRAVSPATRGRVQTTIRHLNYRPSGVARKLAQRRTRIPDLVVPGIANPFFATVVRGVERQAYAHGPSALLDNSDENSQRELSALSSLEEEHVPIQEIGEQALRLLLDRFDGPEEDNDEVLLCPKTKLTMHLVVQASAPGTLPPDLGHGSDASVHRQTKEVRLDREIDPAPT